MEPTLLELLAQEAPAEAFEAHVRAAREAGASHEEIAWLREEVVRALQIRSTLEERRRREVELAALYETAGDLTTLRDVEAVLQAIVRRARQLLSTDTAYLTLFDEDRGDTFMRVTDGTVNPAFARLRLELGAGLGGLVAETASPYATANYLVDERFAHTDDIDEAVQGEGLIAILGVPLSLAGEVIGVLFAANRHERPFARHEVALLSSLADHAAIAIENARLFQELSAANEKVSEHSAVVERASAAHERLTTLVVHGGGLADIVGAVAELLDADGLLIGAGGEALASAGNVGVDDLPPTVVEAVRDGGASGRTVRMGGTEGDRPCVLTPVVAGTEHLGALVLFGGDLSEGDIRTLERAALVSGLVLLHQRSLAEAEQRVRGELLEDLIESPHRHPEALERQALRLGVNLDRPLTVVVASVEDDRRRLAAAGSAFVRDDGGLAGDHRGRLVLLVPDPDPSTTADRCVKRLTADSHVPVTAGAAASAGGPAAVAEAYEEARRCLQVLFALGRVGEGACPTDLGPYAFLLGQVGSGELERYLGRTLGPIVDYDQRRGTELLTTLGAYFATGGNLTRAAERLHVHVNTLYQRLDRVGSLVGEDWREPERALELHLALRLHRLRQYA